MWFYDLNELVKIILEHSSDSHLLYLMIMGGYPKKDQYFGNTVVQIHVCNDLGL